MSPSRSTDALATGTAAKRFGFSTQKRFAGKIRQAVHNRGESMHPSITRLLQLQPKGTADTPAAGHTPGTVKSESIAARRVIDSIGRKAKYLIDGEETTVEECVARHYRRNGWDARVVQNEPWLALRDFLFMGLTHAREDFEGGYQQQQQ